MKAHIILLTNTTYIIIFVVAVLGEAFWERVNKDIGLRNKFAFYQYVTWGLDLSTQIMKDVPSGCVFHLLCRWEMSTGRTTTLPEGATVSWLHSTDPQRRVIHFRSGPPQQSAWTTQSPAVGPGSLSFSNNATTCYCRLFVPVLSWNSTAGLLRPLDPRDKQAGIYFFLKGCLLPHLLSVYMVAQAKITV